MAEHIKSRPSECGQFLIIEMNKQGADMFNRLISRATPKPDDNKVKFNDVFDRVMGAFRAGKSVMGWKL